ncbi:DUF1206 domain-containing protein [Marinobacter sp. F4206]|uniref:DUF1206 domain-containing protein n=1 Tax=Marinobacter sp. F4206 TaxID=2861777 RepID=UPI001C5E4A5E|nr:DUF1206 domain-containing protein [Marinobacter sp. F4206]MBW4934095.1 DUF1206 domain-containing protein [Marinobacter sp. F4206]
MARLTENAITALARMGYAARGTVYLLVGGLAALAAIGQGGQTTGSRGAIAQLLTAPLGDFLLATLALGLAGYAIWRCIQAIGDTDQHGLSPKGLTIRAGLLVSAMTHLFLAFFAISLIFTLSSSSGGGSEGFASWLMTQPLGRWLVGAVGILMIGAGLAHGLKGARATFDEHFDMPPETQQWAYPICRFGLVIRGVVFVVAGNFFVIAAYHLNPREAGGLAEVFDTFGSQRFGAWLIGFVAIGLLAFGIYSLLEAIYRRVDPPS